MNRQRDEQFDDEEDQVLRDGGAVRVPMMLRDGISSNTKARFTDGTNDETAGCRPGFRIPDSDRRGSRLRDAAYSSYETGLTNAYKLKDGEKQCPDCDGSGEIDGEQCATCGGDGVLPDDFEPDKFGSRNKSRRREDGPSRRHADAQMMRDHKSRMDKLIAARDFEDSQRWQNQNGGQ